MTPEEEAAIRARWDQPPTGLYPIGTESADYRDIKQLLQTIDELRGRSGPKVQITRHYMANYGDHAGEAVEAHDYRPTETVENLIERVMDYPLKGWQRSDPSDFIVLRVVKGTEPKQEGSLDEPPF